VTCDEPQQYDATFPHRHGCEQRREELRHRPVPAEQRLTRPAPTLTCQGQRLRLLVFVAVSSVDTSVGGGAQVGDHFVSPAAVRLLTPRPRLVDRCRLRPRHRLQV
jgi:hypothetical protein